MVADCLPVLFAHSDGGVLAAAHAGWRGLAGHAGVGVLEATYASFEALALMQYGFTATNSVASETMAWLGPCIGPQCFEVGTEVREAFVTTHAASAALFAAHGPGKWLADLPGLARLRLHALGITQIYGNDGTEAWCTVSQPSRFFSHRRESVALGGSGRMAACLWIDGGEG
jgi:YfiH family protein